ncbi:hypothetical protein F5Y04DRAFT_261503 [Hypomontagnella monticulosa]|nr:hypothetical protein F5Y04DRAFT_261503 [Hypomontagnella monticulosa]
MMSFDFLPSGWNLHHNALNHLESNFICSGSIPTESTFSTSFMHIPQLAVASTSTFVDDDTWTWVDPATSVDCVFPNTQVPLALDWDSNQANETPFGCISTTPSSTSQGDFVCTPGATYSLENPAAPSTEAKGGSTNRPKSGTWKCNVCKRSFTKKNDLTRHVTSLHETNGPKYRCICGKYEKSRKDNYKRHVNSCKQGALYLYYRCKCEEEHADKATHLNHVKVCTFGQGVPGRPV